MSHTGIYEILNVRNGHKYIGSSVNISERIIRHRYLLRHNKHHSLPLQRAWNKYGEKTFEFNIITIVPKISLEWMEQIFLNEEGYYNSAKVAYIPNIIRGSSHYLSKFSESDIEDIRYLHYKKFTPVSLIAEIYKCDSTTICAIVHNKTWKHVPWKFDLDNAKKVFDINYVSPIKGQPKPEGFGNKISKCNLERQIKPESIEKYRKSMADKVDMDIVKQSRIEYENGDTIKNISERHGISYGTARRMIRREGLYRTL
jgi:group I intron endonuclease